MPPCPCCQKNSPILFIAKDYNRRISKDFFSYYRCTDCKLIFLSPVPINLNDFYRQDYYPIPTTLKQLAKATEGERYKIDIIKQFMQKGRLLEIGAAHGCFANLAKETGFEVETIEMDAECCKFMNEVVGIRAINSSDPVTALKDNDCYDVIAIWHVIEHLPNPWETLKAISESINSGGILVLAAPNPDAFQFQILGRYWPHVDAPRHLMLIPAQLLIEKMASLGMTLEFVTTRDKGGLGWNFFGWEYFFSNLCRSPMITKISRRLGSLVARLLSPIEKKEGKGSAYTMVFRKVD